jgi:hypothetical protein
MSHRGVQTLIQGWQMDEEMESVLLELSSDGSYKCGLTALLMVLLRADIILL